SFTTSGFWSYAGTTVTAGATADVGSIGRLAASATWSSSLDADASSETAGEDRSYDLPLELRVGGSAGLAPGLVLVASAVQADWSTLQEDLSGGVTAHGTTGFGVGVELSQVRLLARRAPLRLGYRRSGLPFALGDDSATESAF